MKAKKVFKKTIERIRKWVYSFSLGHLAFEVISYSGVLPRQISTYLVDLVPGVSGFLFPIDQEYVELTIIWGDVGFLIGAFITILSVIFLFRSRSYLEVIGYFWAGLLPHERKFWGVVSESQSEKPVPFASVRLLQKGKLISQTVADVDGRYRLAVPNQMNGLYLEVKASGYKNYQKRMNLVDILANSNEITIDIAIQKLVESQNLIRRLYIFLTPKIKNFLLVSLLLGQILITPFHFIITINNPIITNILGSIASLVSLYWNFKVLQNRRKVGAGKIISLYTNDPVKSAVVEVYDNHKKLASSLSNPEGVVRFDIDPGSYFVGVVYKDDEKTEKTEFLPIKITYKGYLNADIYVKLDVEQKELKSNLPNPFAQ